MTKKFSVLFMFLSAMLASCSGSEFGVFESVDAAFDAGTDLNAGGRSGQGGSGGGGLGGSSGQAGSGGVAGLGGSSVGGSSGQAGSDAGLGGSAGEGGAGPEAGVGGASGEGGAGPEAGVGGASGEGGYSGQGGSSGEAGSAQGGSSGQGDSGECVPGMQVGCGCNGQMVGIKICGLDQTYGDCECPGQDAGKDSESEDSAPDADAEPADPCEAFGTAGWISFRIVAGENPPTGKKLGAYGRLSTTSNYSSWGESLTNVLTHTVGDYSGPQYIEMSWAFENSSTFSSWQVRAGNPADTALVCAGKQTIGGVLDGSNNFTADNPVGNCHRATNNWGQTVIVCSVN